MVKGGGELILKSFILLLCSWTARFYGDIQSPQADTEDGELDKTPVEFPEVKKKVTSCT